MNKRSKSDWQTLFAEHEVSGLSAAAFCRERDLNPKYFSLRRKQLQTNNIDKAASPFIPITMTASSNTSMVELQLNETLTLKIPLSVSPAWLVALIQQLQA